MQEISYLCLKPSLSCKNPQAVPILRRFLALVCFSKAHFIHSQLQSIKQKLSWELLIDIITKIHSPSVEQQCWLRGAGVCAKPPLSPLTPKGCLRKGVVLFLPLQEGCTWRDGTCDTAMKAKAYTITYFKPKKTSKRNPDVPRSVCLHFLPVLTSYLI